MQTGERKSPLCLPYSQCSIDYQLIKNDNCGDDGNVTTLPAAIMLEEEELNKLNIPKLVLPTYRKEVRRRL